MSDQSDVRSTNHLFVLQDDAAGGMSQVGAVNNYADNEQIYSARFVGDRGYVVTFRQIDPLFSFDLSDPANPQIGGELKIPGFSTYMHPIGDSHLLTIGEDGDESGITGAVAVKLFDVSNLAAPVQVGDSYVPDLGNGYSWSEAAWDHHAFTYYAPLNMLAFPVASYSYNTSSSFAGIIALQVDLQSGLSYAGEVNHSDLSQQASCSGEKYCDDYYYDWLAQPTRSVFMTSDQENFLFTLSNTGIKAIETADFDTTRGSLLLPGAGEFYDYWY